MTGRPMTRGWARLLVVLGAFAVLVGGSAGIGLLAYAASPDPGVRTLIGTILGLPFGYAVILNAIMIWEDQ